MQFYYGTQMPLRVLDEAEFWKEQEEEHTVVIREIVSDLEPEYVKALEQWEKELAETRRRVFRYMETATRTKGDFSQALTQDLIQLVNHCLEQSQKYIAFCNMLIDESQPISSNPTAVVVMKHIIDESEYFIGIAQTILYDKSI
ncbi:hypothetical protein J2Z83_001193 [Virgibacillus natechei]|uniref:DUF2935 domain-containing protein n=1 Tax=Virgibacillus natechei TaxID=1216297 RepID=A0ABS4IDV6_9BACI|nr:DUF2935 domain-containing protein [Virgibacillus natechei]MBP1969090.1 hypothetical protein [Virgibacillus natechei]UZD14357.1 DUF2935 domain-containing protein [Virgibacillus natechei]